MTHEIDETAGFGETEYDLGSAARAKPPVTTAIDGKVSEERVRQLSETYLLLANSAADQVLRAGAFRQLSDVKLICDELLRLRSEVEWQPIETAPRDSSRILVGYRDHYGDWKTHLAWWRLPYEGAPKDRCWWCYDKDGTLLSADVYKSRDGVPLGATHWRPLPPPPALVAKAGKGEGNV